VIERGELEQRLRREERWIIVRVSGFGDEWLREKYKLFKICHKIDDILRQ